MSPRKTKVAAPRSIETDTALAKLARILEIDPAEVEFLADLPVDTLRDLRWRISDKLNAADAKRLAGVMAASKLVPTALAATIGEKWFGPVLCARLVGLVEPKRGGQYARHLSVGFMADITTRTDPRVVGDLIHELDLKAMQRIATTLLERGDHLTLSHFVGHIPPDVVAAILAAIDDNAAVVRIARYVEDLTNLDPVVALLPDDRLLDLVAAVDHDDLWVDGLHLFSHLGDTQIARIATTIARRDRDAVGAALDAFTRHQLWDQGLQLVDHLDPTELTTLAAELLQLDDSVIDAAIAAMSTRDDWAVLICIAAAVEGLGDDVLARIRRAVDDLSPDDVVALVAAVQRDDLWVDGLRLFGHLSDEQIARIAVTLVRQDTDAVIAALEAFDRHHLWTEGLALLDHLDPNDIVAFADVLLDLDDRLVDAAFDAIEHASAWPSLVKIALVADNLGDAERSRLRTIVDRLPVAQRDGFDNAAADAGHPDLLERVLSATSG